jgi:hypothetical protein|uniref:Uncharacterized protein n=1 Tax=Picea sitchensis TaxID=3332 RepID=D5AB31_PICSI|nr:unknown [Picea sitchensis]
MADVALIVAEDYLIIRDNDTRNRTNVNTREGKPGHPRSQLTEGILIQIRQLKMRSDGVQGVAIPLSTEILEGSFSP